jgi:hypothetical protein
MSMELYNSSLKLYGATITECNVYITIRHIIIMLRFPDKKLSIFFPR